MSKRFIGRTITVVSLLSILLFGYNPRSVFAITNSNVYNTVNLGYSQSIIARTVQGIVNKPASSAPPLFIDTNYWGYDQTASKWMDYYSNSKGITFDRNNTLDDLLKAYRSSISGLALYDFKTDATRWIAETYSGINNTLPVSADMVDVALQDNFTTFSGWSVGGDPGASASSNGDYLHLQSAASGSYGLIHRSVTVNVDTHPYIQLNVKSLSPGAEWFVAAYYNGTTYRIPAASTQLGVSTFDLRQTTGFTGSVTFQLQIGVQGGGNKSVDIDWMHIGKYGFYDNFWALTGWTGGSPNGGHSFTTDGELATLNAGPNSYAVASRSLTVNLDDYSYITVKVPQATGSWHVAYYDPASGKTYRYYPSAQTGEFSFHIGKLASKRGIQTFQLQMVVDGGPNTYAKFDRIGIGRHPSEEGNFINSFTISKDFRAMNWTDDTTAYSWAITNLLPSTDKQAAYHVGDSEYAGDTGYWQATSLDIAISQKAFCFRLLDRPEANKYTLYNTVLSNLAAPAAIYGDWGNTFQDTPSQSGEEIFVTEAAKHGHYAVLSTGSNGSFHAKVSTGPVAFNQSRTIGAGVLDPNKYYVAFMTAEGDTFASLNDFVSGNWQDPNRGSVPINWQFNPLLHAKFKGLAEYYRNTATSNDYFFSGLPVGYTFLTEMTPAQKTAYGSFSNAQLNNANLAVGAAWDTHFDLNAYKDYTSASGMSAIFQGIMPGGVDSVNGGAFASVRTLANGVPFVTSEFGLYYVDKNADGSSLTVQGLADKIRTEAAKHKKPFFMTVYLHTYPTVNSTFNYRLPSALKDVAANLGTTDFKVAKLDEFIGAIKTAMNFQDDFEYLSNQWGFGPAGSGLTVGSGKARLSSGSNAYGLMYRTITLDVAKHPYISLNVSNLTAGGTWTANVYDGTTTWRFPAGGSTSTGTFNFDIRSLTGWTSGTKTVDIQIAVNGANKSADIDWIRVGSIQN